MKDLMIITNIPANIQINGQKFIANDVLNIRYDDEILNFEVVPLNNMELFPLYFSYPSNDSFLRITKYQNFDKVEIFLKPYNFVKSYSSNGLSIKYDLGYYVENGERLESLKHFYYDFEIKKFAGFNVILAKYKRNENLIISPDNTRIDVVVYKNGIKYFDTCSVVVIDNDLTLITDLYDQQNHSLVVVLDSELNMKEFYSTYKDGKNYDLENLYQIQMCFFECILARNENLIKTLVTEELKENLKDQNLLELFDNFVKIDYDFSTVGNVILIYKKSNYYIAKKFNVVFNQNKIENIYD